MTSPSPKPFRLQVPDDVLDDLRDRLARVRWPETPPLEPWSTGADVAYMKDLVTYWRTGFDWRAAEARFNRFAQFKVPVAGIDLHFIHEAGKGPAPIPLLLSHGWPGSVIEFEKLLPMLTDPASFGADPADSFTVVAPSLPGYTLSFAPGQPRFGVEEMTDALASLMTDVLGYGRFGAQGGDWGATITSRLGFAYPERMLGIHVNLLAVRRDPALMPNPTPEEAAYIQRLTHFLKEETGYQWIQGTRPTTLSFGLTDSPAGLAAWIAEKFHRWTDNDGTIESAIDRDAMLANITLYWVTGAVGSSFWPYYARMHRDWPIPGSSTIDVPAGYVEFPKEIFTPPRSFAERTYTDIRRWTVASMGGHFAAMEQPEVLAHEIREFFRPLRARQAG